MADIDAASAGQKCRSIIQCVAKHTIQLDNSSSSDPPYLIHVHDNYDKPIRRATTTIFKATQPVNPTSAMPYNLPNSVANSPLRSRKDKKPYDTDHERVDK
jgi:hypothetical protein